MQKPKIQQWNNFVNQWLDFESETSNVKGDFPKLSRFCGPAYFEFLKAQWIISKEFMTEEEFCKMNGNVPQKFFEKNIKDAGDDFEVEVSNIENAQ